MLAYDYPLLGVFWSLLALFMVVLVGFVVIYTFVDNFRRSDHSGAAKAGWALLIIVLPLYADSLNTERFLGFPLGYFLSAHGIAIVAIFTVGSFVNRQDAIDHWHGAHEDN